MYLLKAEMRNKNLKPKQLRRNGIIPGVLYGKDLKESLNIQFELRDAENFLKSGYAWKRIELQLEGDRKYSALLKETQYDPVSSALQHLSFQAIREDQPVKSIMKVVLLNTSKVRGAIQLPHPEITYRALPAYLQDIVEIDLEGMDVGDSLKIKDLPVANDPNIEILDPEDTIILNIIEGRVTDEAEEAEESQEDAGQESA